MDEKRYRQAEALLWNDAGAQPVERRVRLERIGVAVRVREVGEGPPALFIHGGPGADGSIWAHLAARSAGLRCILIDRPGTGLSDVLRPTDAAMVRREGELLVPDVLDALDLDWAHLVGSSHGGWMALLAAACHPDRVGRVALLGCPAFVEGMRVTAADRIALLPGARHLLAAARPTARGFRAVLRRLGHGRSLAAGRIPDAVIEWGPALARHTATMRNEFATISVMGTFREGFAPSLWLDEATVRSVRADTLVIWGSQEVYGTTAAAERLTAALSSARLVIMPGAGHLCWLDDLNGVAAAVVGHLLQDGPPGRG